MPKMTTDPHQRAKDEAMNIALIHQHITNNTPSGQKIREAFCSAFPSEPMFTKTVVSGANRSTHHDLQIQFPNGEEKTVEFKGSYHFKPIDTQKPPWTNGVQFYNGTGSKFTVGQSYALRFYKTMLDEIIQHFQIETPKPPFEEWVKDAFRQGKPLTPFVRELREKGYGSDYLSDCRKKFNKQFTASDMDLMMTMDEVQTIAEAALSCKDYWLQIHGDIDDPDKFYVQWTGKLAMPQIQEIEQITKSDCDVNFGFVCVDGSQFTCKLRWGYGQCITNIRVDIK